MKNKNKAEILSQAISLLEEKKSQEWKLLKEQFHIAYESMKPLNLIKNTFHEVASSPELKDNLISNAIGLTTGYLSKKILVGSTRNPIKNVIGSLIQFAITNLVSRHSGLIKKTGGNILQQIQKYRNQRRPTFHHNGHTEHVHNDTNS